MIWETPHKLLWYLTALLFFCSKLFSKGSNIKSYLNLQKRVFKIRTLVFIKTNFIQIIFRYCLDFSVHESIFYIFVRLEKYLSSFSYIINLDFLYSFYGVRFLFFLEKIKNNFSEQGTTKISKMVTLCVVTIYYYL